MEKQQDNTITVELVPYWNMTWDNRPRDDGSKPYGDRKPDGVTHEVVFDGEDALAHLLGEGQVILNDHWWKENIWPEECTRLFAVAAVCNDVFAYASADAQEVQFNELQDLYEHYHRDPLWGVSVWCMKKRNMMPLNRVADRIRCLGVWDLDSMNLNENPSERCLRERAEQKAFNENLRCSVFSSLTQWFKDLK